MGYIPGCLLHRHQVVTRQELCDTLWMEYFVSDDALEWGITAAQRAIGDNRHAQRVMKRSAGVAIAGQYLLAWNETV